MMNGDVMMGDISRHADPCCEKNVLPPYLDLRLFIIYLLSNRIEIEIEIEIYPLL